ncbi:hypothetical protein AO242_28195 [Pseudomonas sp. ICMP 561]|nr:hypothetical protein AO242_28195 [Pseudomonas sp. ICMP 561]
MNIKPIRSEADLADALQRLEELWGAPLNSPEGDELEILAVLVEKFEEEHFPMPASDPIEAIKFRMDQQGLTPRTFTLTRSSECLSKYRTARVN